MFYIAANERENYEQHLTVERVANDDDIFFVANGEIFDRENITVAIERKKIYKDFPVCVTQSHHHLDQIRSMVQVHDVSYLLIEGVFRVGKSTGFIETPWPEWGPTDPALTYSSMVKHLETLKWQYGIGVVFTSSFEDTCAWLRAIYDWWQKPFSEHDSGSHYRMPFSMTGEVSTMQRILAAFQGIGPKTARAIEAVYPTPAALTECSLSDLKKIEGMGPKRAETLYNAWRGIA